MNITLDVLVSELRKSVAKNKTEKAINILLNYVKENGLRNEAILLSSRFVDITTQIRMGLLTQDAAVVNHNKIKIAILDLANELEEEKYYPTNLINNIKSDRELENDLWSKTKLVNTEMAYIDYIEKSHLHINILEAKQKLNHFKEINAWKEAHNINSKDSYSSYLNNYPLGKFVDLAKNKMELLSEANIWEEAASINTLDSYRKYLRLSKSNLHEEETKNRIESLEEKETWSKAKKNDSFQEYENYMKIYPEGKYMKYNEHIVNIVLKHKEENSGRKQNKQISKEISEPEKVFFEVYSRLVKSKQKKRELLRIICDFTIRGNILLYPVLLDKFLDPQALEIEKGEGFNYLINISIKSWFKWGPNWIVLCYSVLVGIIGWLFFQLIVTGLWKKLMYTEKEYQFKKTLPTMFKSSIIIVILVSILQGWYTFKFPELKSYEAYNQYQYHIISFVIIISIVSQMAMIYRND